MYKSSGQHDTRPKLLDDGENMGIHRPGEQTDRENRAKDGNGAGDEDDEQASDAQGDVVVSVLSRARFLGTALRLALADAVPETSVTTDK